MNKVHKTLYGLSLLIWTYFVSTGLSVAQTLDYYYDPTFTPPNIVGGNGGIVHNMLVHEDGRYLIAGAFQFNSFQITKMVRFLNDGSIDDTFTPPGNPLAVEYVQFFQDGYMRMLPPTLSPIEANGNISITQFFDLYYSPYTPSLPPDPHASMYQILDDDMLLVAGRFSPDTNNLEDRRHLVRVHPDGSPDLTFNALKCEDPFHARLIDLYPTPDGKWLVTGEFNYIEGYESPNIARLNADFSVDTTFQSPVPNYHWTLRILISSHPQQLSGAIDDQNRVYVIRIEPGFANPVAGLKHLRLLTDGSIDTTFQVGELTYYNHNSGQHHPGYIHTLALEPDGSLIVGGKFRTIEGQARGNIAKLNEDGSLIENVFHRHGADTANWQVGSNPIINVPMISSIMRLDNGGLLVGGLFSRYDGHDQWGLVRLLPSPVSVEEHTKDAELKVFPNPTSSHIRLQLPPEFAFQSQITVYNIAGQVVSHHENYNGFDLLPMNYPPGLYVVEARSEDKVMRGKVVVE